jgi:hypothetical protein
LSYVILASTNLSTWQPIFTNDMPGLLNFTDYDSTNYPARFYRMSWPLPDQPPQLSAPDLIGPGTFQMHVDSTPGEPWAIQSSTDLVNWVSVFTNQPGGAMDFVDARHPEFGRPVLSGLAGATGLARLHGAGLGNKPHPGPG